MRWPAMPPGPSAEHRSSATQVGRPLGKVTFERNLGRRQQGSKGTFATTRGLWARARGGVGVTLSHLTQGAAGQQLPEPQAPEGRSLPAPRSETRGYTPLQQTPYPKGRVEAKPGHGPHAPGRMPGHRRTVPTTCTCAGAGAWKGTLTQGQCCPRKDPAMMPTPGNPES